MTISIIVASDPFPVGHPGLASQQTDPEKPLVIRNGGNYERAGRSRGRRTRFMPRLIPSYRSAKHDRCRFVLR